MYFEKTEVTSSEQVLCHAGNNLSQFDRIHFLNLRLRRNVEIALGRKGRLAWKYIRCCDVIFYSTPIL